jgi:SAM-dependent methyltransferase
MTVNRTSHIGLHPGKDFAQQRRWLAVTYDPRTTRALYDRYVGDNDAEEERLRLLCEAYDAISISRLNRLQIASGGRCMDVGAGLATISAYLASRLGGAGRVLATEVLDYGTRRTAATLTHVRHRLGHDPLPNREFDLIFCRGVLNILINGKAHLSDLVDALKPGGQLVIETFDFDPTSSLFEHAPSYIYAQMVEAGRRARVEVAWGPRLAEDIEQLGLTVMLAESTTPFAGPGHPGRLYWATSLRRARPFICSNPTDDRYDADLKMLLDDPSVVALPPLTCVAAIRGDPA